MTLPTSPALDHCIEVILGWCPREIAPDTWANWIAHLRRLQHEASTAPPRHQHRDTVVFDLDRYRQIREDSGMCYNGDDPDPAA